MRYEQRLRSRLVKELRQKDALRDDRVAEAFATVRRQLFVPGHALTRVYGDNAIVTKTLDGVGVSSSSQPAIMSIMLEQLDPQRGHRVLEIGAGTGYNAALLSWLVGPSGRVTTVDLDTETASSAKQHLREAGTRNVRVIAADGGYGNDRDAPYDRIIATASCWQVPQPWLDQLVDGGVLVLPFRLNGTHVSLALRKQGDELTSISATVCGFMPLRGAFGPQFEQRAQGVLVAGDAPLTKRLWSALDELLADSRRVHVSFPRRRHPLSSPLYYVSLQGDPLLRYFRPVSTWGLVPFLLVTSARSAIAIPWLRASRGRLPLFGSDEARDALQRMVHTWHDEGQPDVGRLRARVRPTRARLGPLPRRRGDRYRFRRGDHLYEFWFE